MSEKVLLFGGTFDPVHNGHLIIARSLAEAGGFDRVVFVPTSQPPHKPPAVATPQQRLEMLRLAIQPESCFDVSDVELGRAGPSYTVDTLRQLRQQWGPGVQLNWVIGADMLEELPRWREVEQILALARLVVALRPPWHLRINEILARLADVLGGEKADALREAVLPAPLIEISSSQIRQRLAKGYGVDYLTPNSVLGYIRANSLYFSS